MSKYYNNERKELFFKDVPVNSQNGYISFFLSAKPFEENLDKDVSEFTTTEIVDFLSSLHVMPLTALNYLSYLRKYATVMAKHNYLSSNLFPALSIGQEISSAIETRPASDYLIPEDLDTIRDSLADQNELVPMIVYLLFYGVTFSEMVTLKLDLLGKNERILLTNVKNGELREVKIPLSIQNDIKRLSKTVFDDNRRFRAGSTYVFRTTARGKRENMSETQLRRIMPDFGRSGEVEFDVAPNHVYTSGAVYKLLSLMSEYEIKSVNELKVNKELILKFNQSHPDKSLSMTDDVLSLPALSKIRNWFNAGNTNRVARSIERYNEFHEKSGIVYPDDVILSKK